MKREITKEEFLEMNETEREEFIIKKNNIKLKKYEYSFKNSWKNYSAFRIDFAPSIYCVKQRTYTSIGFEWFGFTFTVQRNLKGKKITLNNQ